MYVIASYSEKEIFMKIVLALLMVLPTVTLASESFVAQGVGYYCFQEYASALEQAKSKAEESAQDACVHQRAKRISDFQITEGTTEQCQVIVEAEYTCH